MVVVTRPPERFRQAAYRPGDSNKRSGRHAVATVFGEEDIVPSHLGSLAAAPAARHPTPFLSVPCGAGLLPPAAGVLARLGVGSRWHWEAWAGCWEAAAGMCACKGALYFLYALPIFYTPSCSLISATIVSGECTMSTTTPCSGSSSTANWLASNPGGIKWP
jgi:hypothetical protein